MSKACFVTIEGGEGAGKSSVISHLSKVLEKKNIPFVVTREPGGCLLAEEVRKLLLNSKGHFAIGSMAELLLFLSARAQHVEEVIAPAIQEGKVVLCDRFNDSSVAYQGFARGLGESFVKTLCEQVTRFAIPNLTFLLDIDPNVGLERAGRRVGGKDRIEQEGLKFHTDIRQAFLRLAEAEKDRFCVIDASQSLEVVLQQAEEALFKAIEKAGFSRLG